jgi:GH18 family chitinase
MKACSSLCSKRGIYARNYNVTDLAKNAQCLTHILYAFANLEPSGQVILGVSISKNK